LRGNALRREPLRVIERVSEQIHRVESGLPPGVRVNAFYDRTELIRDTMATLSSALWQEGLVTIGIVLLFLLHLRASLAVAATLPLAVLASFIGMQALGISSNIMSLAGIAIAIGELVDMAIVMTENVPAPGGATAEYVSVTASGGEVVDRAVGRRSCTRPRPRWAAPSRRPPPPPSSPSCRCSFSRSGGQALRPAGLDQDPVHGRLHLT
jgi:hypothetical protein